MNFHMKGLKLPISSVIAGSVVVTKTRTVNITGGGSDATAAMHVSCLSPRHRLRVLLSNMRFKCDVSVSMILRGHVMIGSFP